MGANLRPAVVVNNGGTPAPAAKERRWRTGHSDPVARFVSVEFGLTPKTCEHRIRNLPRECAAVIRAFHALGDGVRLERFVRPILTAYEQREAPPLVPATWTLAQDADAHEERAETAYHIDPSDGNLDRYVRALEAQQQRGDALLMAARAEQQRRRSLA